MVDWSRVAEIAIAIVAYGITFQVILWVLGYELKPKLKYKFNCPFCTFSASANDQETITIIQSTHRHQSVNWLD